MNHFSKFVSTILENANLVHGYSFDEIIIKDFKVNVDGKGSESDLSGEAGFTVEIGEHSFKGMKVHLKGGLKLSKTDIFSINGDKVSKEEFEAKQAKDLAEEEAEKADRELERSQRNALHEARMSAILNGRKEPESFDDIEKDDDTDA